MKLYTINRISCGWTGICLICVSDSSIYILIWTQYYTTTKYEVSQLQTRTYKHNHFGSIAGVCRNAGFSTVKIPHYYFPCFWLPDSISKGLPIIKLISWKVLPTVGLCRSPTILLIIYLTSHVSNFQFEVSTVMWIPGYGNLKKKGNVRVM